MKNHIGIDQYGYVYQNLGQFPRKALMHILNCKHAENMYQDTKTGAEHTGYVIANLWISVFTITPFRKGN